MCRPNRVAGMRIQGLGRCLMQTSLVAALSGGFAAAARAQPETPVIVRVRSSDAALAMLLERAAHGSGTMRDLVAAIERSNGIVIIEAGTCGHGVRACLKIWMKTAGDCRYLRVVIDRRSGDSEIEVMSSIGHELQHAIEALSEPGVTDSLGLYNFFGRIAATSRSRFETTAALHAGDAVFDELR